MSCGDPHPSARRAGQLLTTEQRGKGPASAWTPPTSRQRGTSTADDVPDIGRSREPSAQCGSMNRRATGCRCCCEPGGGIGEARHHLIGNPGATSVMSRELGSLDQGNEPRDSGSRAEPSNPLGERFHCADAAWDGFVPVAHGVPTTPAGEGLHIGIDVQCRKVTSFVAGPRVCGVEHAPSAESKAGKGLEQMMQGSQHASPSLRSLALLFLARFAVVRNEPFTEPYP